MSNRQTAHGDAKSPAELVGLGGLFRSRGVERDTASQPCARWDPYTHLRGLRPESQTLQSERSATGLPPSPAGALGRRIPLPDGSKKYSLHPMGRVVRGAYGIP